MNRFVLILSIAGSLIGSIIGHLYDLPRHTCPTLYENEQMILNPGDAKLLPGAVWRDTDGNMIQAHGGQVQRMPVPDGHGGKKMVYVWIGENKTWGHTGNPVSVYTSEDLISWECHGDVLKPVPDDAAIDNDPYFNDLYGDYSDEKRKETVNALSPWSIIERPKMLYNEMYDNYVLWFHSDGSTEKNDYLYDTGMAGVAVSDSPYGPFRFTGRYRLSECPEDQIDCFPASKGEARDMNLFKDDDGTAYITYTSENNKTIYLSKLNEDYTYLSSDPAEAVYGEDYIRIFPGAMREAPALTKGDDGRYYLMTSSTTGWMSNQARVWSADEIFGNWKNDGNPCADAGAFVTYDTQSTCLFRTESGDLVYMGDRWNPGNLADSRYIWLPAEIKDSKLKIFWTGSWNPGQ
ncbi:MAG: family 43 glycosylhydrolase [Lachnospiraceae bacterium]|nr:family 43 glycosylhydrolase [Lachnospiraceae bacterium]